MTGRADRDQQSAGVHGGGGSRDPGGSGRADRDQQAYGALGPTTSWGAPTHTNQKYGVTVAQSPGSWQATNQRVDQYNQAAEKWNLGAQTPSFANALNNFAPLGLSMEAPQYGRPKTYVGGDYHLGVNPAAAAVDLATMAMGVPGPWGSIAGKAYNKFGGQDVMLGGGQVPGNWADHTGPMTGSPGSPPGTQVAGHPGGVPGGQNTGGNPMLAFGGSPGGIPGGATFGQQPNIGVTRPPQPPVMTPPGQPGQPPFFTPQLPNHTVPQGYQSAFQLSDRDKALLYSKALTGAA